MMNKNDDLGNLSWAPLVMLFIKEVQRCRRVAVQTVVTPVITSSLYLLIFGVSLGQSIQLSSGVSYLAFIIPGLMMMGVLNNAFQNSSTCIVSGKFTGELEDYRSAPFSDQQIIWAIGFGGLLRGALVGIITFFMGELFFYFYYGQWLGIQHPLLAAFFIFVGGLSFSFLGLAVAFWARTFDQMAAIGGFVLLPLIYLGGVFFSLENLSPFWQSVSRLNPLFYVLNGVRYSVLGHTDVSLGVAMGVALIGLAVMWYGCVLSLRYGSFSRW